MLLDNCSCFIKLSWQAIIVDASGEVTSWLPSTFQVPPWPLQPVLIANLPSALKLRISGLDAFTF
ncbi:Uncharacterised protein [Acinetobacter baumannii]|nr:Uncharacterised protein [Acinetobacter baumannii]